MQVAKTFQRRLARDPQTGDITLPLATYRAQNAESVAMLGAAAAQCGVKLLNPTPYLCPNGRCIGTMDRRAVIRDEDHLTEFGNRLLVPVFATIPVR